MHGLSFDISIYYWQNQPDIVPTYSQSQQTLFPTSLRHSLWYILSPLRAAIYYSLFRVTHAYGRTTCKNRTTIFRLEGHPVKGTRQ